MKLFLAYSLLVVLPVSFQCPGFSLPSPADVVRPFGPTGRWSGHWGVDVAVEEGSSVRSIGSGRIGFVGVVVSNLTVTVDHGGGIVSSYSYLGSSSVRHGEAVRRGSSIGTAAIHDGAEAFHLSVRVGGTYIDPIDLRRCSGDLSRALYLASHNVLYPRRRVRLARRNIRPPAPRTSCARERRSRAVGVDRDSARAHG